MEMEPQRRCFGKALLLTMTCADGLNAPIEVLSEVKKKDFDKEMQEAVQLLWNIIKKYGIDVSESYSEESGEKNVRKRRLGSPKAMQRKSKST